MLKLAVCLLEESDLSDENIAVLNALFEHSAMVNQLSEVWYLINAKL
jgi:hypothetical protein